ncbi:nuclear transport factor 2 family protein [Qipengyuania mesophila]
MIPHERDAVMEKRMTESATAPAPAISDAEIEDLLARRDIYSVLTRYCRALDRADVELMKSVYWPDGSDSHGVFDGNAVEFSEFIVREIQEWFEVTMHGIMNVHMEVEGDRAATETYLFAYHKVREEKAEEIFGSRYMERFAGKGLDPAHHHFFFGGRYLDKFERREGEWRIFRREVVMDWNENRPSNEILDQGMFATLRPLGERGPGDPVWGNRP